MQGGWAKADKTSQRHTQTYIPLRARTCAVGSATAATSATYPGGTGLGRANVPTKTFQPRTQLLEGVAPLSTLTLHVRCALWRERAPTSALRVCSRPVITHGHHLPRMIETERRLSAGQGQLKSLFQMSQQPPWA